MLRTNTCGELNINNVGEEVHLSGWIQKNRDLGGMTFIDLRDRTGLIQVVFDPENLKPSEIHWNQFRSEWIIKIKGLVKFRPKGTENSNLNTGKIELIAKSYEVINISKTLPFEISDYKEETEDVLNRLFISGQCDEENFQRLSREVYMLLEDPNIAKYFTKNWHVKTEKEILTNTGRTYIPDRLLFDKKSDDEYIDVY